MNLQLASVFSTWLAVSAGLAQVPPVPTGAADASVSRPRLSVAQRVIDLGKVLEGDKIPIVWRLENQGSGELIIEHTRASCGCTVVQLAEEDKVVAPGGTLELKAEFDSRGRAGLQQKTVSVYSNDPGMPVVQLELMADVYALYDIQPPSVLNLGTLRRGESSERTIELLPAPQRGPLELVKLEAPEGSPVLFSSEAFESQGRKGQRISIAVSDTASPGPIDFGVKIHVRVDATERERNLPIRGQIVGALTWQPQVVDATRVPSAWGKRFAPIVVRSTDAVAFDIVGAEAGPLLEVEIHPKEKAGKQDQQRVTIVLREGTPPGPFAATVALRTNLVDQPVVRIPVFGIVAEPVAVDPPIVLLRQDGTDVGKKRRVKLQSLPQRSLELSSVRCDLADVTVSIAKSVPSPLPHIAFLNVELTGSRAPGRHQATITISTGIPGAETLDIPVVIDVPDGKG